MGRGDQIDMTSHRVPENLTPPLNRDLTSSVLTRMGVRRGPQYLAWQGQRLFRCRPYQPPHCRPKTCGNSRIGLGSIVPSSYSNTRDKTIGFRNSLNAGSQIHMLLFCIFENLKTSRNQCRRSSVIHFGGQVYEQRGCSVLPPRQRRHSGGFD